MARREWQRLRRLPKLERGSATD